MRWNTVLSAALVSSLLWMAVPAAAEDLKVISAEEAAAHDGKDCIVEFKVNGGRLLADRGICFLNSLADHRDKKCFTAVIRSTGLKAFQEESKIDNPYDHFKEKKIRVKGRVSMFQDRPQIIVEDVGQIEVVKP